MDEMRLKLAVQKSGRLTEPSLDLLTRYETKYDRQTLRTLARFEARRTRKAKNKKLNISKQSEPNAD